MHVVTIKLPFQPTNDLVVARAPDGWLVACEHGAGIVRGKTFEPTEVPGVVTAACFDGRRTWLALARSEGWRRFADSIGVLEPAFVARQSLAALGSMARVVPWLASDGDDVIVTSSVAQAPEGRGWALHRIGPSGELRASFELVSSAYQAREKVTRVKDELYTRRGTDALVIGLDLQSSRPAGIPLWNGMAAWEDHWMIDAGGYSEVEQRPISTLTVRTRGEIVGALELDEAPNTVSLGDGFVAWSIAKKLYVRTHDGQITEPKTYGWVDALSTDGRSLAVAVGRAKPPRVHVITFD